MKSNWHTAALAFGCFLLAGSLTAHANDGVLTAPSSPQSTIDTDLLLALVAEVKNLRLELLQHRLESHDQRLVVLELELDRVAVERSENDKMHEAMDEEVAEIEFYLQDADLDTNRRRYLEAMREELDKKRTRTLDQATRALDAEEDDLKARHKELLDARKLIAAHIDGLIGTDGR